MNPAFICKSAIRSLKRRWLRNCTALAVVLAAMQFLNMYAHAIMKSKETFLELHALTPVTGYITSFDLDRQYLSKEPNNKPAGSSHFWQVYYLAV